MVTQKEVQEWIKTISTCLATVIIPLVIFFVGQSYTKSIEEREKTTQEAASKREIAEKYIELATAILKENQNPDIRDWAVDIINYYSDVKMSGKVKQEIRGYGNMIDTPDIVHGEVTTGPPKK